MVVYHIRSSCTVCFLGLASRWAEHARRAKLSSACPAVRVSAFERANTWRTIVLCPNCVVDTVVIPDDRRALAQAAQLQYVTHPRERHDPGVGCAPITPFPWLPIQASRAALARSSRHCSSEHKAVIFVHGHAQMQIRQGRAQDKQGVLAEQTAGQRRARQTQSAKVEKPMVGANSLGM